uniref:Uncharacterized protein n=1 Tax=Aegilops tauschii TaxID=37682 RepID=N1R469_AEGTA
MPWGGGHKSSWCRIWGFVPGSAGSGSSACGGPAVALDVVGCVSGGVKARGQRLPVQPGALGRLRRVLDGAAARCVSDATFADWLKVALDNLLGMVDTLDDFTRTVDNLTARLQATCRPKGHHKGSRRCVSPAGKLAGLHGNDLFRTLMTLQLPAEFFLEVALAAQSLIVHDQLDLFIELSEKIILEGDPMAIYEYNFMAFKYHTKTLDK